MLDSCGCVTCMERFKERIGEKDIIIKDRDLTIEALEAFTEVLNGKNIDHVNCVRNKFVRLYKERETAEEDSSKSSDDRATKVQLRSPLYLQ